jgi:Tfp pilus assembly protein PilF
VLQRDANNPYALLGLARLDIEAGRDDQARERLESVVRQTNYQLGYDLIVSLYERTGRRDRAATIRGMQKASGAHRDPPDPWLEELTESCFDPYRLALAAGMAGRIGDSATARRLLERAVEIDPNDISARFQLGTLAVSQGDARTAREQLERCTVLAPDFADAWAHLSSLQAELGDRAGAERTLATGLRHCPQSPGLHLMRARSLKAAGRTEEAINEFTISIRLRPNEPDAYIELGNTLIAAGREPEGVEQMKRALETDPANPLALTLVALSAISAGDQSEADQWLNRVAKQPRTSRDHISRLLEAYRKKFGREWRQM